MGNRLDCSVGDRKDWVEEDYEGSRTTRLSREARDEGENGAKAETISRGGTASAPLPKSPVWKLQKQFYSRLAEVSWKKDVVPSFPSTNLFIANAYARAIIDFAHGRAANGNMEKLYIVEFGGGSGKLAFNIVNRLVELNAVYEENGGQRIEFVYVMTDFYQGIIDFWLSHPPFQPMFEQGLLDVAIVDIDCETDLKIELQRSGVILQNPAASPLVCVCNYLFDSLVQDAFQIRNGRLFRAKVEYDFEKDSLDAEKRETSVNPPAPPGETIGIQTVRDSLAGFSASLVWNYDLCDPKEDHLLAREMLPCGNDMARQALLKVLRGYTQVASSVEEESKNETPPLSVLVPLGAIRLLLKITDMVGSLQNLLLLASDKGYHTTDEFDADTNPHLVVHGSFSFMTNFHLIESITKDLFQTSVVVRTMQQGGFKTIGILFEDDGENSKPCKLSLERLCSPFSAEQYAAMHICYREEVGDSNTLHPILALMRLGCHDATTFISFKQAIIDRSATPFSSEQVQHDLDLDLERVVNLNFPFQRSRDLAFEYGRVCMALRKFNKALMSFQQSVRECGSHHITHYNMGICHFYLEEFDMAKKSFELCLELCPSYTTASDWLTKVNNEQNAKKNHEEEPVQK